LLLKQILKGKELIGDLEFPLRAAVRKFDKPNGIFQWFPIKNPEKGDKTGEVLLFVEYADPRSFGGPTNVEHKGHVGITQGGGFEIRDIPQEWKQLFRVLNIKKKDLENNPQMAQEVFDIMKNADITNINQTASEPATNNNYTPAATPQVAYTPQPPQQESTHAAVAPPPVPSGGGPKPPPPPPSGGGPRPPPPPATISPKPPTPPAAETQSSLPPSNGGGSGSIFDQLKNVKLKKAEVNEAERGAASTGNALADTLLTAMSKYRVDIAGKDDDGDDWSE
jgi:Wiskott-Aldrich syndrome protein